MSTHSPKRRKLIPPNENEFVEEGDKNGARSFKPSRNSDGVKASDTGKASREAGENPTRSTGRRSNLASSSAELAFASGLYKSSFFKLQVDELLTGLRPNYDQQISKIQKTLHKLKGIIEAIPNREPRPLLEAEKELRKESGIAIPFPEPRPGKDTKYTFGYSKPVNINVVGSLALKTWTKTPGSFSIDLAVTIPSSAFQEKDYLNYRYFHKRAYYIACIAAGIKNQTGLNAHYCYQDENTLRPVIVVEPTGAEDDDHEFVRSKISIRIITAIENDVFPISKLLPEKNNIRQNRATEESPNTDAAVRDSTPEYNATLRSEATVAHYLKFLHSASVKCDAFGDSCLLGRTWLHQRAFKTSHHGGGFGHFEWAAMVASLFHCGGPNGKPVLSQNYSSYQIFKATIQFIVGTDLIKQPLLFSPGALTLHPTDTPMFYDGKSGLNILYKMSPWSYRLLRHEARLTLAMLNAPQSDNFDRIFITRVGEPLLRFDHIFSIKTSQPHEPTFSQTRYQSSLYNVLSQALGDRSKLINLSVPNTPFWSLGVRAPPTRKEESMITVALLLDAENANRIVDHGPSTEDREAALAFQKFWGEKAELRRFKDGSILESLVWSDQSSGPSVVQQIVLYILNRHFNFPPDAINSLGDNLGQDLCRSVGISLHPTTSFQALVNAFRSLEKNVQEVEGLPLTLRQLSSASASLRHTSIQSLSKPADIVLQFEGSAKWPDDLAAIQMTKIAFLIKIGDLLEQSHSAISARVGLENEGSKYLNRAFLDISTAHQNTFRLRIHHDREQTLLERLVKDPTHGARLKEEAAYGLAAYKRNFIQAPRYTQAVHNLCNRYPLLSSTIRIMKHWCASHLFGSHLPEELIELFVIRVFVNPSPWGVPSSVLTGLLRTLDMLSRWDWQQEPLVVDFNGELNVSEIEAINTRLVAWRNIDPAMNTVALFVATNIDHDGVTWSQYAKPPKVVAARLSSLAKAATRLIKEKGVDLDAADLFTSPLSDYDFVLHLDPKHCTGAKKANEKFKNLRNETGESSGYSALDFFINEIHSLYGQSALCFHNEERNVIAGVWNPQTIAPKKWGLKLLYSTAPNPSHLKENTEEAYVTINKPAILNEISALGGTMVKRVEMK
ncbi:hypothetical protein FQN54_004254 [Arachnomyces sp. PD_36]|nr:hypothetical protein FQN54_004254 [Arachnomyces sp. PD_36]